MLYVLRRNSLIKLSTNDEQYLMSYVRPENNGQYQVRLLAIFTNGFLTSDGFYKEVWADNKPKYEIDMPTIFNAASALDLPVHWREYRSHITKERTTTIPDNNTPLKFIDIEKALVLSQQLSVPCPDKDDIMEHYVYDYEYTWCVLDSKK